jgi:hypothetical protein
VNPRIAFVTTCKGRLQHLKETLPQNLRDNAGYENCVFVVLDYCSPDGLREYIATEHAKEIACGRVVLYSMTCPGPFKMAHAKNMAHRCGMLEGADILVSLDADGYTGVGFAEYIADHFAGNPAMFMQALWNRWVDVDGELQWLTQERNGEYGPPVPKGSNGRMVVTVGAFLKAGGYDEKYENWGPDDKDFNIRLRRLGYIPHLLEREFLNTILHNDKIRFREYPEAAHLKGYEFCITVGDSPNCIANFGVIGCGVVFRNFSHEAIVIEPLPTRIFGIGMHKTATTSLHLALKKLGLESAHWTTAHWAKAIWREMNNTGKSPTLEQHYALSDIPIPLLYRKLDAAYPGSKFILTTLDDEVWVKAAEAHWDYRRNPNRANWDSDPFSHRIHEVIYGQREFNREVFLARYRHHNRDVMNYFKDRPGDLLVMRMNQGAGWGELCEFLGMEVPDVPYPHGNRDGESCGLCNTPIIKRGGSYIHETGFHQCPGSRSEYDLATPST